MRPRFIKIAFTAVNPPPTHASPSDEAINGRERNGNWSVELIDLGRVRRGNDARFLRTWRRLLSRKKREKARNSKRDFYTVRRERERERKGEGEKKKICPSCILHEGTVLSIPLL